MGSSKAPIPIPTAAELLRERQSNSIPFTKSPFVHTHGTKNVETTRDGELRVKVADEVPWTDLLLEVSMTTAFASLTDGTPILTRRALLSYVCFFILVWWIWASQVAYNLRFRQSDWLHRVFVFLQLAIFSALAAFTRDFDIAAGLLDDDSKSLTEELLTQFGVDENNLQAIQFRDHRLPKLNARGIAMTMALSRLLLLAQYAVVCYHGRRFRRNALIAQMVPLAFSALCFFTSFLIIGSGNTAMPKSVTIAKIILWYAPMFVELASYFIALELPGKVTWQMDGVISRSGTVFIIILGGGLDKITTGFQYIVGNTGLGADGIPLFVSAAVIFVCQFALYFRSSDCTQKIFGHRMNAWVFVHFLYLAALIMSLQGVATSLSFSNINHAIQAQTSAIAPVRLFMQHNPGVNLTAEQFPDSQLSFQKLGLSFPGFINVLNTNIELSVQENDPNIAQGAWLQQSITLVNLVLQPFEADPKPSTLLWAKLHIFQAAAPNNMTEVNMAKWSDIYDGMIRSRGSSVLWFYPTAGSTLIALAVLSLIRGRPRDMYEMASVICRFSFGAAVMLLSIFDSDSSDLVIDENGNFADSLIWRLTLTNWILPIFALAIGSLSFIEFILACFANHQYLCFDHLPFRKKASPNQLNAPISDPYMELVIPAKAFHFPTPSEKSFYMGRFSSIDSHSPLFHYATDKV